MSVGAAPTLDSLTRDVQLLSLDAGNTVIFLDHFRMSRSLARIGFDVSASKLVVTEGEAKRLQVDGKLVEVPWKRAGAPGARGWGMMVGTFIHLAGVPKNALADVIDELWDEHVEHNFWSVVPEGLGASLDALRARGVKVVIVSNSEGMLEGLFKKLGIFSHFDHIVDSGLAGVEKPDPRIFELALAPYGIAPDHALHLGDSVATDIEGGKRAGLRVALIDPFDHWEGRFPEVARVPGVVAVADCLAHAPARA